MTLANTRVKIHIARKELDLEDDDYRAILVRLTGKSSSKNLNLAEATKVLDELKARGFKPKPGRNWRQPSSREDVRYIYKLWWALAGQGKVRKGKPALNAFVTGPKFRAKWGDQPTDVEIIPVERARDVIEALKDMCRRHRLPVAA